MTRTSITRRSIRGAGSLPAAFATLVALVTLVTLGSLPCLAQTQTEGYDPLRQISTQVMRANLMILLDITGSMTGDVNGHDVGVDSVGAAILNWSGSGSSCGSSGNCKTWTYTLTFSGMTLPSRMATVKNALGNSVNLVTGWKAPGSWPAIGWNTNTITMSSNPGPPATWTWVGTWGSYKTDPLRPFTPASAATAGNVVYPAQNLVGTTADKINWGLVTFHTSGNQACSGALKELRVAINSNDTGDASAIQPFLKLQSLGGLDASGYTPTRAGLQYAKDQLQATFALDSKKACNRPYGIILVTDGQSNSCNPSDGEWSNCPTSYTSYPAGVSESIWNTGLTSGSATVKPHVWAIGISPEVGRCELNYTAYKGGTDAKSPNGDAGFATTKDPYLPDGTPGTYDTTHGDYAFFANDSASIGRAFAAIVAGTGTGDYATSAPLSAAGATASNIVTIPTTDYPSWLGHFYAYDSAVTKNGYDNNHSLCYQWVSSCYGGDPKDNSKNPCIPCMKWDAGYVLSNPLLPDGTTATPGYKTPAQRWIYTWNPANANALVEVTTAAANLATLQTIVPSLTAAQVDFIRGNDGTGTGTGRSWRLGPIINSTPALIAAPLQYTQNTVNGIHLGFRVNQAARNPVVWVGSDDGMLHGFNLSDGKEQVALLPPGLLARQATLYDNYKNQGGSVTGQVADPASHVYGVANSLRYSDIYFSKTATTDATFKTVGFLANGPGGAELTAIDLTHPSPGDYGYGFGSDPTVPCTSGCDPVRILWRVTPADLPGLYDAWSIPALAPLDSTNYMLLVGGGFKKANTAAAQSTNTGYVDPIVYGLDPTIGNDLVNGNKTWTMMKTNNQGGPLVGNQAFADSVLLKTWAKYYQEDNLADLGLQADLNGRIWFVSSLTKNPATFGIGINATVKASTNQQPIYYPPAASGYGVGTAGCDVFAFASGTLYERSPSVTGKNIGVGPAFEPSLYVATAPKPATIGNPPSATDLANNLYRKQINSLTAPTCPTPADPSQPPCVVDPRAGLALSNGSQVTAPPYLLVPRSGTGITKAFFLVYDPNNGCNGFSYVVELDVTNNASCANTVVPTVYAVGVGAASGFTITDDTVRVAKSGIGTGAKATIFTVPNVVPTSGGTISTVPQWWRELK